MLTDHTNRTMEQQVIQRLQQESRTISKISEAVIAVKTKQTPDLPGTVIVIDNESIGSAIASRRRQFANCAQAVLGGIERFILRTGNAVHFFSKLVFAPYLSSGLSIIGIGPISYARDAYKTVRQRWIEVGSFFDFLAVGADNGPMRHVSPGAVVADVKLELLGGDCHLAPSARNDPNNAVRLVTKWAFDAVHKYRLGGKHLLAPFAFTMDTSAIGLPLLHKSPFGILASIIKRRIAPEMVIDQAAAKAAALSRIFCSTRTTIFSVFASCFMCCNNSTTAKAVCQYQIQQKERGFILNFAA